MTQRLGQCLLLVLLVMAGADARAELTEAQAKAGFMYNLARFVEWPQPAFASADAPLLFCTHGLRPEVETAMPLLSGKLVGAHPIRLEREPAKVANCHILYVGQVSRETLRELVPAGSNVLVVSDEQGALRHGAAVVVELVPAGNRLAFNVDLGAAQRAELKLGAPLLRLAREVVQP